jgi:5S rRNA maturation endonuclease (ribonuclease M5)
MKVKPEDVDIRLAVGEPVGESPIKMMCPLHFERIGQEDDSASLAVYRKNVHCFGCGFHITRRYASLAFLLGLWDGRGDENSERVREAVRKLKHRLKKYTNEYHEPKVKYVPPPIDPVTVEVFHQYLLLYREDRLVDELMTKRGLSDVTVEQYRLGHTGTHFTIPVPHLDGTWATIRYRTDEDYADKNAADFRKYEGTWGRNAPLIYPLSVVRELSEVEELWIVEGEYDAIASNQAGNVTLTITNGAGNIAKIYEMVKAQLPNLVVRRWVVAVDQDSAGEQAANALLSVLYESGQVGVRARWSGAKDLTDYYASGGSKRRISYE